ncbi:hypothetical protein Vretifemale_10970 [Volvox reticuliferus]|uniref:Uncharacterized protein n=1 Tax=Volvox reticuliferus TaxID=1737510 RepID=A0A8J4CFN2_9CHLO|nr:hypothetical protein Vretifemale_10970 [Volvox reticuliferus]
MCPICESYLTDNCDTGAHTHLSAQFHNFQVGLQQLLPQNPHGRQKRRWAVYSRRHRQFIHVFKIQVGLLVTVPIATGAVLGVEIAPASTAAAVTARNGGSGGRARAQAAALSMQIILVHASERSAAGRPRATWWRG